jgi:cell wall-associated NlpC family hydrolase
MVSQQLFGEYAEILEEGKDHWVKLRCRFDGYEGWCQGSHLAETAGSSQAGEEKLTPEWITKIEYNGHPMMLPLGSSITDIQDGYASWGENKIRYEGRAWDPAKVKKDNGSIRQLAYTFLNTPYLWGGKTVFGTDCSGFTQTLFRFFNIHLLRDAWQQAGQGKELISFQEARFGDLAFFDNDEGRITHVGMMLGEQEIIHASGKVRVDRIDEGGIIHAENFGRTHRLRLIKRYF